MSHKNEKQWLREYEEFLSADEVRPPLATSQNIMATISQSLQPRLSTIITKLVAVHVITATFSLGFCDQMGVQPWSSGINLSSLFMTMGHAACMLLCGFLFVSLSVFSALMVLSPYELQRIRQHSISIIPGLSLVSFLVLFVLGAQTSLIFAGLWMLGALVGGSLPLLLSKSFRVSTVPTI